MPTEADKPRRRVALFVTCMVDQLYPNVGMASVHLLEQNGVEVCFPQAQTCCGQPAFNAGYRDEARQMAMHFLDVFHPLLDDGTVHAIVAPSGSCVAMVKHFYRVLFSDKTNQSDQRRAAQIADVTYELTQYLGDVLGVTDTGATLDGRLTYHPCCHLLRELNVDEQPRFLLSSLRNVSVVALPGDDECCGFGGLFAIKNAEISTAMGKRKVKNLEECGADVVALNDVSCMTHINGILERVGSSCRAVHIAELLAGFFSGTQRQPPSGG
jgi:L-lactate dehydrogenase complex protein LldE